MEGINRPSWSREIQAWSNIYALWSAPSDGGGRWTNRVFMPLAEVGKALQKEFGDQDAHATPGRHENQGEPVVVGHFGCASSRSSCRTGKPSTHRVRPLEKWVWTGELRRWHWLVIRRIWKRTPGKALGLSASSTLCPGKPPQRGRRLPAAGNVEAGSVEEAICFLYSD